MLPNFQKVMPEYGQSFIFEVFQAKEFVFYPHYHPEYELTAIVRGRGKRFVGNNISGFAENEILLLGPNLSHTWESEKNPTNRRTNKAAVMQFLGDFPGGENFWQIPELGDVHKLLQKSSKGIYFNDRISKIVIPKILQLKKKPALKRLFGLIDILNILAKTDEYNILLTDGFIESVERHGSEAIENVFRLLHENYDKNITLSQTAKVAHMSLSNFSRFFKKTTGKTFPAYLNAIRISKACDLLIETDLSITEICFQSGFNSLANFNRRFLKTINVNPSQFRKLYNPETSTKKILEIHNHCFR